MDDERSDYVDADLPPNEWHWDLARIFVLVFFAGVGLVFLSIVFVALATAWQKFSV